MVPSDGNCCLTSQKYFDLGAGSSICGIQSQKVNHMFATLYITNELQTKSIKSDGHYITKGNFFYLGFGRQIVNIDGGRNRGDIKSRRQSSPGDVILNLRLLFFFG
ncbi:hypothetical protein SDJN02_17293, partial [Cucurbita argyrosperma subsp. argyrosperma]